LGGTFKTALEAIGDIVGGLVTGFSKLVGFISNTIEKMKDFVNFIKNNPVTQFFFGGDGSKGLKASTSFEQVVPITPVGKSPIRNQDLFYDPNGDPRTFTGAPLEAFSPGMQAAILRKNELAAETARLRAARETAAAARSTAMGGLTTAERIVINVNAPSIIDQEGFTRAATEAFNNSYYRGTNGATNLVGVG
jgi:hypothetical protein